MSPRSNRSWFLLPLLVASRGGGGGSGGDATVGDHKEIAHFDVLDIK